MAGRIKLIIDKIISERSKGNPTIALTTRTKIILKGVNPDQWSSSSSDDPTVLSKVTQIAQELGVSV